MRGAVGVVLLVTLEGCAFHQTGLVHPADDQTVLETPDGRTYRLLTSGQAAPLAWLDGHQAEIDGTRLGKTVRVSDWKVVEGLHGLSVWVGTLERKGAQVGLLDRNSGAYYVLDSIAAADLAPFIGKPILLEGVVEGAHQIRVLYFRVLAPEP